MSVFIFFLIIAILIFVHELGHFIAAKLTGMKVQEFSIGFKPALFQKKVGETNYIFGLIPIGGYVKILGENPNEEIENKLTAEDKKRTFTSKSKISQIIVLSMGVIFNVIFAWILISLVFMLGFSAVDGNFPAEYTKQEGVRILAVEENYPAAKAGLNTNTIITKISSGDEFVFNKTAEEYSEFLQSHPKDLIFTYKEDPTTKKITRVNIDSLVEEDGKYLAGIFMADTVYVKTPFIQSFYYGGQELWLKFKSIFFGLVGFFGDIFTGKAELNSVSGPVGIVDYVQQAAEIGWINLILFTAILSLNLAIINFLPFPALDGGRIIFVLIEIISRKKLPNNIFNWVNGLGFMFLIGLMVVVTFNDVLRLF